MTIGERLKLIRKDSGLNQTDFGLRIGLSQTTIGLYESDNRPITDRTISQVCHAFGISDIWLKSGCGDMYVPTSDIIINDSSLDAADKEILQSYVRMTPAQRQFVKSWIKEIAASINQAEAQEDDRERAHRLLDQELDSEKEDVSASTTGSSATEKKA